MKKTLALALTAAMAISAVSATAFAASQTVKEKPNLNEQTLTVKVVKGDVDDSKQATDKIKIDKDLSNTTLYKFVGWTTDSEKATIANYDAATSDNAAITKYNSVIKKGEEKLLYSDLKSLSGEATAAVPSAGTVAEANVGAYTTLYPVFRRWANQEEYDEYVKNSGDSADKDAKAKAFEDKVAAADETHNATNNDNTGTEIKTNKVTTSDAKKWKVDDDKAASNAEIGHDARVAKLGDNDVAFYYKAQGFKDDAEHDDKLVSGKNTRVEMTLPDKYTTDNMDVTVYKVTGWCDSTKIKKANMMTNGNKVVIWDNATDGRYIVALSPKGASAGTDSSNPSTGDFSALPIAMLAVAALGATGFVAYKKRMAE